MKIQSLGTYRATIKYRLPPKPDALPDGSTHIFQAFWTIEEDYLGGEFTGEFAMIPAPYGPWVPSSELVNVQEIPAEVYYKARKSSMEAEK